MSKTTEAKIGLAVMKVLATEPTYTAPVRTLVERVPEYLDLTSEDREGSATRPSEKMWEQRVRNLKSHDRTEGNVIGEGLVERPRRGMYRLTRAGIEYLQNKGIID